MQTLNGVDVFPMTPELSARLVAGHDARHDAAPASMYAATKDRTKKDKCRRMPMLPPGLVRPGVLQGSTIRSGAAQRLQQPLQGVRQ